MHNEKRKVRRVLVMLDYGDGEPGNGEVFDLTALANEVASKCPEHKHAKIELSVYSRKDYGHATTPYPQTNEVAWDVMADFHSCGETGFLDDAINSAMPDSFATQEIRKKLNKLQDKAEKFSKDIQVQRLLDAAQIRHSHPIARVTEAPVLTQVAESTQTNA